MRLRYGGALLLLGFGLVASFSWWLSIPAPQPNQPTPSPVSDRLAEPTLPPDPSQADEGAQLYWLYCMPCHGDRGQGLTAEFRALYPPEEQNCWQSGCHGDRPYENGWTLPRYVPPLIGPGRLARFETAAGLQAYLRAAMPWHAPGSLDDETYWKITAYLLRENGVPFEDPLGAEKAASVFIANRPLTAGQARSDQPPEARWDELGWAVGVLAAVALGWLIVSVYRRSAGRRR